MPSVGRWLDRLLGQEREELVMAAPAAAENWREQTGWLNEWGPPLNIVAGEAFNQPNLRRLARCDGPCLRLVEVTLEAEPDNAYDSNAIKAAVEGLQVGHLRAFIAAQFTELCRGYGIRFPTVMVAGVIRGGRDEGYLGVHLWLEQTLTAGPVFETTPVMREEYGVNWPPGGGEMVLLQ